MNLTPNQQLVLSALTTEWQSPKQITDTIQSANSDLIDVNQSLKDLLQEGLVQANPVVIGLYRLTALGTANKTMQ